MINIKDEKLMHLVHDSRNLIEIRQLLKDSIKMVESGNILIGLDITDLEELLKDYKELHIGMVNSKDTSNSAELVEELIKSTKADVSVCNSVYLYLKGDVSLMDVNEVATSLEEKLGEEVNIVFTATYSEIVPDEYGVMALFLYDGEM